MTNQTLIGGGAGLLLGGLAGYFLGVKAKPVLGSTGPELLGILGAGAGALLLASIANETAPSSTTTTTTTTASNAPTAGQTSSAQGTVPAFVPGA